MCKTQELLTQDLRFLYLEGSVWSLSGCETEKGTNLEIICL